VPLDIVLKFQVRPGIPLGPDRLEALSYAGGEAAAKQGSASRLPCDQNSFKMHPRRWLFLRDGRSQDTGDREQDDPQPPDDSCAHAFDMTLRFYALPTICQEFFYEFYPGSCL
jgi:hypothetical protein